MFVLKKENVPSLVVIPYSDPYNVLLFNKGDQSFVWITFADNSSIDAGYSFAFSGKSMTASGIQTYGDFEFVSSNNYFYTKLKYLIAKNSYQTFDRFFTI